MPRYVDLDKLPRVGLWSDPEDHGAMVELRDVIQALRQAEAQTGEVAPVVHGHWVYKRRRSGGFRIRTGILKNGERVKVLIDEREDTMEPFCSVCGTHNDSTNDQNMRYCPHCWAKMDGEAQNGKTADGKD